MKVLRFWDLLQILYVQTNVYNEYITSVLYTSVSVEVYAWQKGSQTKVSIQDESKASEHKCTLKLAKKSLKSSEIMRTHTR